MSQYEFETIGVVGAGVMGSGVAHAVAACGMRAVLMDVSQAALQLAAAEIEKSVRFAAFMKKDGAQSGDVLSRIAFTTELDRLSSADFVVENVTERWSIKEPVYRRLDGICRPGTILAANTSCIPITKIASATSRPAEVIGIHFMNPVPLKPTVEVIRGHKTSEDTLTRTRRFLADLKKDAIVVNDLPGFVSNRVLMLMINEAIWVVQDQVSTPENVDRIFTACMGHKMGPLMTADLIGLDTILASLEVLLESYGDPKFRPAPLLKKMVDAGLHGKKTGEGFFKHQARAQS